MEAGGCRHVGDGVMIPPECSDSLCGSAGEDGGRGVTHLARER